MSDDDTEFRREAEAAVTRSPLRRNRCRSVERGRTRSPLGRRRATVGRTRKEPVNHLTHEQMVVLAFVAFVLAGAVWSWWFSAR